MAQLVKNLPAVQEAQVQLLGWEDPLEKGKACVVVTEKPIFYSVSCLIEKLS